MGLKSFIIVAFCFGNRFIIAREKLAENVECFFADDENQIWKFRKR